MPRLFEFYAPIFARGLEIESQLGATGVLPDDPGKVRRELLEMIALARRRAAEAGKPAEEVERATFAVVAWLDEVIARFPDAAASFTPLQVELFHIAYAGNEFFVYLRAITAQQDELREVYYTALCLGFVGEYIFDPGELERLKEVHAQNLPVAPLTAAGAVREHVTPQPYGVAMPPPRLPRHWERPLLAVAIALALAVPLGLLAYYYLQPEEEPVIAEPEPEPEPEPRVDIDAAVRPILAGLSCGEVSHRVADGNRVTLTGYVGSDQDLDSLRRNVAAVPGVQGPVEMRVEVQPWPFCEMLQIIAPFEDPGAGLRLAIGTGVLDLREGEPLVFDITPPSFPSYLYFDFVQHDGEVYHLLRPTPADGTQPAGGPVRIERAEDGSLYVVTPPFGREMLVAVATERPLFETDADAQGARVYLPELRRRVEELREAAPDARITATHLFITTYPKTGQ